jgi:hypothetical protein
MKHRARLTCPAAWSRLRSIAGLACLLAVLPANAGSATAGVGASVVEPVYIARQLGLPASALEIYLSQLGPAGPQTGSVLIRVIGGLGDQPLAVALPQAAPIEAPQGLAGGTVILGRGLAMAVMASMGENEERAHDDKPVAITIAFN